MRRCVLPAGQRLACEASLTAIRCSLDPAEPDDVVAAEVEAVEGPVDAVVEKKSDGKLCVPCLASRSCSKLRLADRPSLSTHRQGSRRGEGSGPHLEAVAGAPGQEPGRTRLLAHHPRPDGHQPAGHARSDWRPRCLGSRVRREGASSRPPACPRPLRALTTSASRPSSPGRMSSSSTGWRSTEPSSCSPRSPSLLATTPGRSAASGPASRSTSSCSTRSLRRQCAGSTRLLRVRRPALGCARHLSPCGGLTSHLSPPPPGRIIARFVSDTRTLDGELTEFTRSVLDSTITLLIKLGTIAFVVPLFGLAGLALGLVGAFCAELYIHAQMWVLSLPFSSEWPKLTRILPFLLPGRARGRAPTARAHCTRISATVRPSLARSR